MEVDLWEVSLVTFPMLHAARAVSPGDEDAGETAARALAAALRAARDALGG
jgi:phage head maturation protease